MNPLPAGTGDPIDQSCSGFVGAPDRGPMRTDGALADCRSLVKRILKGIGIALGMTAAILPATTCWAETWLRSGRDEFFLLWGQAFALVPGLPGKYLRRCFYALTLRSCSLSCDLGFMTYFNDRRSEVGHRVVVGFGVRLGLVSLRDGCMLGSRASVVNGGERHMPGPDGKLTPPDRASARRVRLGEETWIGEGAIIMADVGSRCIVSAGSVVSRPVPDGCLAAGNPARFVSSSRIPPEDQQP